MLPVIAIVGRPNVGKSTLFNRLTKSRDAIVANMPGVTRDRQYGEGQLGDRPYIIVDTAGITGDEIGVDGLMAEQIKQALEEADQIIFMVDARDGLTPTDAAIARQLRQLQKKVYMVANKIDGLDPDMALAEFYELGMGDIYHIAAAHGRGVTSLIEHILEPLAIDVETHEDKDKGIKIAFVGRPNVGKSTLINRLLGEERVIVYDEPGTTRDSIFIPFERHGKQYTLIDTAGVRRRGKVHETVEKFSVIKTLRAIEAANVVIFVFDAQQGIAEQDLKILSFIIDAGRALVVAFNKWDGMDEDDKKQVKSELERRLEFLQFARFHFISALHGTGVGHLYKSINEAYESATREMSTPQLTAILEAAIEKHQPPMAKGRRIKLRYAHPGGHNPPIIVIHGNQTDALADSYKRYLMNTFRDALKIMGSPIRLQFKSSKNPFAGRRNKLTPRQQNKKKRLFKHLKKSK
ncbi:MAG: ribosome biogenesis GTPase Der [Legionellales bacterium]|nr:ribosome biogenesis GTPase Der [Legionellales bacterium]|tara:strand:- start:6827 stop:8218 length:1392 start_codon:yes stop_codon:yes gene_type:complete